jgi:hypothetical protein
MDTKRTSTLYYVLGRVNPQYTTLKKSRKSGTMSLNPCLISNEQSDILHYQETQNLKKNYQLKKAACTNYIFKFLRKKHTLKYNMLKFFACSFIYE